MSRGRGSRRTAEPPLLSALVSPLLLALVLELGRGDNRGVLPPSRGREGGRDPRAPSTVERECRHALRAGSLRGHVALVAGLINSWD